MQHVMSGVYEKKIGALGGVGGINGSCMWRKCTGKCGNVDGKRTCQGRNRNSQRLQASSQRSAKEREREREGVRERENPAGRKSEEKGSEGSSWRWERLMCDDRGKGEIKVYMRTLCAVRCHGAELEGGRWRWGEVVVVRNGPNMREGKNGDCAQCVDAVDPAQPPTPHISSSLPPSNMATALVL